LDFTQTCTAFACATTRQQVEIACEDDYRKLDNWQTFMANAAVSLNKSMQARKEDIKEDDRAVSMAVTVEESMSSKGEVQSMETLHG